MTSTHWSRRDYRDQAWHRALAMGDRAWHLHSFVARLLMSACYQLMAAGHTMDNDCMARVQVSGDNPRITE